MQGQMVVVSDGTLVSSQHVTEALTRAGVRSTVERDPTQALARLRTQPRAVVIDAAMAGAASFVGRVRADRDIAGCPMLSIVPEPTDASYAEALAWGVDEVVPANGLHALGPVARSLGTVDVAVRPPANRGTVLVASGEATERLARSRPLRNAGFDVVFATDAEETRRHLGDTALAFAVIDGALHADGATGLARVLAAHATVCPTVVVVARHEVDRFTADLTRGMRVRVLARHEPPDDAIFLGNEMIRADPTEGRVSERLLHATLCAFRPAGSERAVHGMSYNLSAEGLYVRTLLPPTVGTRIWIELRPPHARALVQLEASVVWSRAFGTRGGATAPAGFGARITDGTARSREAWLAGYTRLLTARATLDADRGART